MVCEKIRASDLADSDKKFLRQTLHYFYNNKLAHQIKLTDRVLSEKNVKRSTLVITLEKFSNSYKNNLESLE
jgi:hypothetical protein